MTFDRQAIDRHRRAVGVFPDRRDAEQALHELRDSGFPMDRVSIITRDSERHDNIAGAEVHDRVGNKADEGAKVGAVSGGALGGITGLLVGLGTLAIPGIGPILLAGAGATVLATTAAGVGIGAAAGGLLGALIGLGIPEERARVYNDRVAQGQYLVMVEGTDQELARAEAILHRRGIEEYGVYDMPAHEHRNAVANQAASTAVATGVASDAHVPVVVHDQTVNQRKRAIGVFSNRRDAEAALTELRDSGFSMDQVSIIAKDADHHGSATNVGANVGANVRDVNRTTKADEGAKAGAATGGALGGLGGLLVGLGALALPGIGPVILGGAAATALGTALSGGAIGAAVGGLTGGLVGLGIPEDRARVYNDRFSHGDYLVMVDGTEAELHRAEAVLNRRGIRDWSMFDATDPARPNHLRTGIR
jgi:hypothetical protein